MWKFVYQDYLNAYYLGAPFSKETLKDHLQETLKKLKMANSMKRVQNKQHYNVMRFWSNWKQKMSMQTKMF